MRRHYLLMCFILVLALIFMLSVTSVAAEQDSFSTKPTLNHGKKWRIGYLQGGSYPTYELILEAIIQGLINLGWIEDTPLSVEVR